MMDWTIALFFHNDVVKLVVDSGLAATARDLVVAPQAAKPRENTSSSALPKEVLPTVTDPSVLRQIQKFQ